MDHAEDGDDDDVFVYMGGDQVVPVDVTHVRVYKSVKKLTRYAFSKCRNLVSIEMHDGVEIIQEGAFEHCTSLRRITLPGVRVIGHAAFWNCTALEDVEFGDNLEKIGASSFEGCISLRIIKIPKVRIIEDWAFYGCKQLTDVELLSEELERIEERAFYCRSLRRIAMPLKANLLRNQVFYECKDLSTVDLIGGIHKTISSLLLESWRNNMNDQIGHINRILSNTPTDEKNAAIRRWMGVVLERIGYYKREHYALLKNNTTQLELALWKVNLHEKKEVAEEKQPAKKAKLNEELKDASTNQEANIDIHADKQQARVTCGANIIIPHVLSFLNDDDVFPLLNQNA